MTMQLNVAGKHRFSLCKTLNDTPNAHTDNERILFMEYISRKVCVNI